MSKRSILSRIRSNATLMDDVDKQSATSRGSADTSFWNPPWDASKKTGVAIIAFLPFKDLFTDDEGTTSPYIFVPDHTNLQTKKRKIWRVLCTDKLDGRSCPICAKFWEFWNRSEEDKNLASKMGLSRKRHFMSNIIVLKNDSDPTQVGKVFKWRYGITINDKVMNKLNPEDGLGEEPVIIHDLENIVPFKVKLKEKSGFRNYDDSEFQAINKHLADFFLGKNATEDAKNDYIDNLIDNELYSISDFVSPDDYKSDDEMKKIVDDVLDFYEIGASSSTSNSSTGTESAIPRQESSPVPPTSYESLPFDVDDSDSDSDSDSEFNINTLFDE